MATLAELMAEFLPGAQTEQTKEAAAKPASTAEIDRVLEDLGLASAESVKTASENVSETKTNGGSMNLMDIYNEVVGQEQTPAAEVVTEEGTEKVASEQGMDENHPITQFGGLVGDYFNVMFESMAKEAGDLEAEAGKGESPVAHQEGGGSMSHVLGKPADAHMPANHSASSGAPLHVTTKNTSPYALNVVQQKLLKRLGAGIVGEQKQ